MLCFALISRKWKYLSWKTWFTEFHEIAKISILHRSNRLHTITRFESTQLSADTVFISLYGSSSSRTTKFQPTVVILSRFSPSALMYFKTHSRNPKAGFRNTKQAAIRGCFALLFRSTHAIVVAKRKNIQHTPRQCRGKAKTNEDLSERTENQRTKKSGNCDERAR